MCVCVLKSQFANALREGNKLRYVVRHVILCSSSNLAFNNRHVIKCSLTINGMDLCDILCDLFCACI